MALNTRRVEESVWAPPPGEVTTLVAVTAGTWPAGTRLLVGDPSDTPATATVLGSSVVSVDGLTATWALSEADCAILRTHTRFMVQVPSGAAWEGILAGTVNLEPAWSGGRAVQRLGTVMVGPQGPAGAGADLAVINAAISDYLAANPVSVVSASAVGLWGHSYMFGSTTGSGGSVTGTSDMATLIASGLGLPIDQNAVSGASLYTAASSGDWADVLQGEPRGSTFEPLGGAWAVMYGINDAASLGRTPAALAPFKSALTATTARLRAAAVFEDTHATVTKTGTWATNSATNRNSGTSYAYTNTASDTVTWTPPTDFPGGTLSVILPAYGDGGSAVWKATVNGTTYTHNTADYALTGNNPTVGVLRVPNVPRNVAPIVLTVDSVSASGAARAMFDCVMWEPVEHSCGVVALIKQPKPLDYTSQSGAPAGPVTDAGVDVMNQIIDAVAAEFGSRVVTVDTSDMDSSPDYFTAGNIHPNGAGHARLAARTVAAIQQVAAFVPTPAKPVQGGGGVFVTYTPVLDGTGTTQGNATVTGAYVQANGTTTFQAFITLGASTVIGTSLRVSLPVAEKSGTLEMGRLMARAFRSGTGYYELLGQLGAATGKVQLRLMPASPSAMLVSPSATTPLTWAAGDVLYVTGTYRHA